MSSSRRADHSLRQQCVVRHRARAAFNTRKYLAAMNGVFIGAGVLITKVIVLGTGSPPAETDPPVTISQCTCPGRRPAAGDA